MNRALRAVGVLEKRSRKNETLVSIVKNHRGRRMQSTGIIESFREDREECGTLWYYTSSHWHFRENGMYIESLAYYCIYLGVWYLSCGTPSHDTLSVK